VRSDVARRRDATLQSVDIHVKQPYGAIFNHAHTDFKTSFRLKNVGPEGSPSVLATLTVGDLYHIILTDCIPLLTPRLTQVQPGVERLPLLIDCRTMRALVHLDAPLAMYLSSAEPIWLELIPNIKPECFERSARVWASMLASSGRLARWFVEPNEPLAGSLVSVEIRSCLDARHKAMLTGTHMVTPQ
jgi:hypothetical protein